MTTPGSNNKSNKDDLLPDSHRISAWEPRFGQRTSLTLQNVYVDPLNWVVYHEGLVFVPWVTHMVSINDDYRNGFNWRQYDVVENRLFDGRPIVSLDYAILIGGNENVYHHTIDYLACVLDPIVSETISPLLAEGDKRWQRDLLEMYNKGGNEVVYADKKSIYFVRELIVIKKFFDAAGRNIRSEWIDLLRARFQDFYSTSDAVNAADKLYISRNHARSRRLRNEEELCLALHTLGFQVVHPEELTIHEQINAFKKAKIIIGPTGAGFTNIAYANRGTLLVQFMPRETWIPPQIEYLAQACGVVHKSVLSNGRFEDMYFTVEIPLVLQKIRGC